MDASLDPQGRTKMPCQRHETPWLGSVFTMTMLAVLTAGAVEAADIGVVGGWSNTIGSHDLIAGASTDFRSPIESDPGLGTIDVANTGGQPWSVRVRLEGSGLPAGVALGVRRTTNGSGGGNINGGTDFLVVGDQEQTFFTGAGDLAGIGLQLRFAGVSISQGPGFHDSTLVYRIE